MHAHWQSVRTANIPIIFYCYAVTVLRFVLLEPRTRPKTPTENFKTPTNFFKTPTFFQYYPNCVPLRNVESKVTHSNPLYLLAISRICVACVTFD